MKALPKKYLLKIILLKPCKDLAFSPESLFYVSDFESDFKDPLQIRSLAFQKSSLFASMKALPKKLVICFNESSSKIPKKFVICFNGSSSKIPKKFVICFNESSFQKVRYLLQ